MIEFDFVYSFSNETKKFALKKKQKTVVQLYLFFLE